MGGGAAMRSAAKVAGMGVVNAGMRSGGIPSSLPTPAEHPVLNGSVRSAVVTSAQGLSHAAKPDVAAVPKPAWEDDWDFASFEEEAEPVPRVVFGPAPTLEEAMSATHELKDALEKASPSSSTHARLSGPFGVPCSSLLTNSEHLDTKGCITCDPKAAPLSNSAMRAFTLLNESPAVQSVVASIASDPNVWDSVVNNAALQEFLQAHKTTEESVASNSYLDPGSPRKLVELCDDDSVAGKPKKLGNGIVDIVGKIKTTVIEMASNAFAHLQNIFGSSSAENVSASSDATSKSTFMENTMAVSLLGLAVVVIMVVVLKRV